MTLTGNEPINAANLKAVAKNFGVFDLSKDQIYSGPGTISFKSNNDGTSPSSITVSSIDTTQNGNISIYKDSVILSINNTTDNKTSGVSIQKGKINIRSSLKNHEGSSLSIADDAIFMHSGEKRFEVSPFGVMIDDAMVVTKADVATEKTKGLVKITDTVSLEKYGDNAITARGVATFFNKAFYNSELNNDIIDSIVFTRELNSESKIECYKMGIFLHIYANFTLNGNINAEMPFATIFLKNTTARTTTDFIIGATGISETKIKPIPLTVFSEEKSAELGGKSVISFKSNTDILSTNISNIWCNLIIPLAS